MVNVLNFYFISYRSNFASLRSNSGPVTFTLAGARRQERRMHLASARAKCISLRTEASQSTTE